MWRRKRTLGLREKKSGPCLTAAVRRRTASSGGGELAGAAGVGVLWWQWRAPPESPQATREARAYSKTENEKVLKYDYHIICEIFFLPK
jgi:hypothetical protein